MLIRIRWNDSDRVAEVSYRDVVIDSEEKIEAWSTEVFAQLDAILAEQGGRFPLVIDVTGLFIAREMANRFTEEISRPVAKNYATAFARYGQMMRTRAVIAVEDMRRAGERDPQLTSGEGYRANLFDTRREAIRFVCEQHARASLFDEP